MREDDVAMYCGKRIEDMTREELIEALNHINRLYMGNLESSRHRYEKLAEMVSARR